MRNKRESKSRTRTNVSVLSGMEGVVLPWMARRLPMWVTPDKLTALGILSGFIIGAGYLLTFRGLGWIWLASAGLIIHWWADSLDGTLARVRKIERPKYGFFVDHYSDALTVTAITAAMGLSPIMDLTIALLLLTGYHALAILVYIVTIARGEFKISFGRIGPTEVRVIIIAANTFVFFFGNPIFTIYGYTYTLFSLVGLAVAAGFGLFFLVSGAIERNRMLHIDRKPKVENFSGNGHRVKGNGSERSRKKSKPAAEV